jgi:RHS repeat-associated protein
MLSTRPGAFVKHLRENTKRNVNKERSTLAASIALCEQKNCNLAHNLLLVCMNFILICMVCILIASPVVAAITVVGLQKETAVDNLPAINTSIINTTSINTTTNSTASNLTIANNASNITRVNGSVVIRNSTLLVENVTLDNITENLQNLSINGTLPTLNDSIMNASPDPDLNLSVVDNLTDAIIITDPYQYDTAGITQENIPYFEYNYRSPMATMQQMSAIEQRTYIEAGVLLAEKNSIKPVETAYFIQDHLGSVMKVLNGVVEDQDNTYYAFGETESTGANTQSRKYNGKEFDADSGLYYYGSRYYAPEWGRFAQADSRHGSIENPLSLNRYVYVENNPLNYADPTGNAKTPLDEKVTAISKNLYPQVFDANLLSQECHNIKYQTVGAFMGDISFERGKIKENKVQAKYEGKFSSESGSMKDSTIMFFPGTTTLDTLKVESAKNSYGFDSVVHEMTHGMQQALHQTDDDFLKIYNDADSSTDLDTKGLLKEVTDNYIKNHDITGRQLTNDDKIVIGRDIGPNVAGKIASGTTYKDPVLLKASMLSDKFINDKNYRNSLRKQFTTQYKTALDDRKLQESNN